MENKVDKLKPQGLTPKDYENAVMSQSAYNLSGIVRTFAAVIGKIWDEGRRERYGTDWVNQHPICRLYAEQISHLSGAGLCSDTKSWLRAMEVCEKGARGPLTTHVAEV